MIEIQFVIQIRSPLLHALHRPEIDVIPFGIGHSQHRRIWIRYNIILLKTTGTIILRTGRVRHIYSRSGGEAFCQKQDYRKREFLKQKIKHDVNHDQNGHGNCFLIIVFHFFLFKLDKKNARVFTLALTNSLFICIFKELILFFGLRSLDGIKSLTIDSSDR